MNTDTRLSSRDELEEGSVGTRKEPPKRKITNMTELQSRGRGGKGLLECDGLHVGKERPFFVRKTELVSQLNVALRPRESLVPDQSEHEHRQAQYTHEKLCRHDDECAQ